jgi:hypothetical protein
MKDDVNIPHAIPVVTDYPRNKNAGQPIRMEPRASPQEGVTGRLADDACFQMADFINTVGLTSSQRDTFFKLELVSTSINCITRYLPQHRTNISHGETIVNSWKTLIAYPPSLRCTSTGSRSATGRKRSSFVQKTYWRFYNNLSVMRASKIKSITYHGNITWTKHAKSASTTKQAPGIGAGGCRYKSSVWEITNKCTYINVSA